jgi:phosphatidylserine/phosphatidylglycerophosphate/cardiolipin synthase-like enzyme
VDAKSEQGVIEILNQSGTRERLETLINQAERYIFLVSPYVTLDKLRSLVRSLQGALARKVKVKLVFRERDASSSGNDVLASETVRMLREAGMELRVLKDLHAKIYLSEKSAILTSLNLLESSFNNSIEVGTWIAASNPAYQKVVDFLKTEIHPTSVLVASLPQPAVLSKTNKSPRKKKVKVVELAARDNAAMDELFADEGDDGCCIRCGIDVEFNPDRPLCRDCFKVWSKYEDANYPEKFCQLCGSDEERTSFSKPLCGDCFEDVAR